MRPSPGLNWPTYHVNNAKLNTRNTSYLTPYNHLTHISLYQLPTFNPLLTINNIPFICKVKVECISKNILLSMCNPRAIYHNCDRMVISGRENSECFQTHTFLYCIYSYHAESSTRKFNSLLFWLFLSKIVFFFICPAMVALISNLFTCKPSSK